MSVRKVSKSKISGPLHSAGRAGEAAPAGISPILRSSWRFAEDIADRFSRELKTPRMKEFLNKLSRRFVE